MLKITAMKIKETHWAGGIGLGLLILFTALLVKKQIDEGVWVGVVGITLITSVCISVLPRLKTFDLTRMKIELEKIEQKIDEKKAELVELYGGIENLKINRNHIESTELGQNGGGIVHSQSVSNYMQGCIKRERQRLAKIFINEKSPARIAEALVDSTYDRKVFWWSPANFSIDDSLPDEKPALPTAKKE